MQRKAMFQKIAAAVLILSAAFAHPALADEAEFQSADFFSESAGGAGLWLWQMYAETDGRYVETDMCAAGRKYLSTNAASHLPHGAEQEFYAVKTFVAPYAALALISIPTVSDEAQRYFRIKILKNDTTVLDWTDPAAAGGMELREAVQPEDKLHFVVKRVGESHFANMEMDLNPAVALITGSTYMKNARVSITSGNHITDIYLTLANYVSENTEGIVLAAMYCDDAFLGVEVIDGVKAEKYKKQDIEISVPFDSCNRVELLYLSDFNSIRPLDFPVILNTRIGEEG